MIKSLFPGKLLVSCLTLVTAFSLVFVASGQTARIYALKFQRPKDCGLHDYDEFKNSSFDLLGEAIKTDINYEKLNADIQGNLSGEKEFNDSIANADISKLKTVLKLTQLMNDRVKKLTSGGNKLHENSSEIKPATTAKQATSNTKNSMKAVSASMDLLNELTAKVTEDIEALAKRIAKKGGTVREDKDEKALEPE